MTNFVRRLPRFAAVLGAAAMLALTGCDDDGTSPDPNPTTFDGAIEGVGEFDEISGTATLELDDQSFDVALTLTDYPDPGDGFPWIVLEGTCADPGDEVGELDDYPLIELDEQDEWSDLVALVLDDEADGYVLEVRRSSDDASTVIACGDLERD